MILRLAVQSNMQLLKFIKEISIILTSRHALDRLRLTGVFDSSKIDLNILFKVLDYI